MKWALLAFFLTLILAYWNKGLLIFLLYSLLYEIVVFLLLRVDPRSRISIVIASILGYVLGSYAFYSEISWREPREKSSFSLWLEDKTGGIISRFL